MGELGGAGASSGPRAVFKNEDEVLLNLAQSGVGAPPPSAEGFTAVLTAFTMGGEVDLLAAAAK